MGKTHAWWDVFRLRHVAFDAGTKPHHKRRFHWPYRGPGIQPLPNACGDGESLGVSEFGDPDQKGVGAHDEVVQGQDILSSLILRALFPSIDVYTSSHSFESYVLLLLIP